MSDRTYVRERTYVAISTGGTISVHLPDPTGNYATACGLDGDDPDLAVDQATVDVPVGRKIDCASCHILWRVCQVYTAGDFVNGQADTGRQFPYPQPDN